ncbi:MAG: F0F1 ATP synthase subunit epsilon [Rhodobacteraceae bacterium]|nr:F0F1 ATP synthase subunit epsilon [Paracoccaceae bacterium]
MADTMQFDLVSPERSLASLQATAVQIPGAEGDMTAMPNHAPLITTLRPGVLKVESPEGTSEYVVTGGFAELGSEGLSVLAEKAIPVTEMTRAHLDDMIATARAAHDTAKENQHHTLVDDAAKLLADMEALGTHMSL